LAIERSYQHARNIDVYYSYRFIKRKTPNGPGYVASHARQGHEFVFVAGNPASMPLYYSVCRNQERFSPVRKPERFQRMQNFVILGRNEAPQGGILTHECWIDLAYLDSTGSLEEELGHQNPVGRAPRTPRETRVR